MTSRHEVRLDGCRTNPLASYLKALGILRIVGEQVDPAARGWWQSGAFHLSSSLDEDRLAEFLLREYRPTPVLNPWNGGSGFYPGDKKGLGAIDTLSRSTAERFEGLRNAIDFTREFVARRGYDTAPKDKEKTRFLIEFRASADESLLKWIDAAVALGTEGLLFPPLLGSGGNDGRLDFSVNYLDNLAVVFDPASGGPTLEGEGLLRGALFDQRVPGLQKSAIGQYAPGSAGGPNASSGFEGSPNVNPWDLILAIEGTTLFAASAVRRLESSRGSALAYPFTVRPTGAGAGSTALSDGRTARAEIWLPIWTGHCTVSEIERVFAEGRIVLGSRTARDGLDVARAVAMLGVDRGIEALERYAFFKRAGNQYLATSLGRLEVRRRGHAELIDDLERSHWLDRFRRLASDRHAPARLVSLGRRLEDGLFELARRDDPGPAARDVIEVLGECQSYLGASPQSRAQCPPVPLLRRRWDSTADDRSPEYAIARGIAALHGTTPTEGRRDLRILRTAEYLYPVTFHGREPRWSEDTAHRVVWGAGPVIASLTRVLGRRLLDAEELRLRHLPLRGDTAVPIGVVVQWIGRPEWDSRVARLVRGLTLLDHWKFPTEGPSSARGPVPAVFSLLAPYFTPAEDIEGVLTELRPVGQSWIGPAPSASRRILRLLTADRVPDAVSVAQRDLRARGLPVPPLEVSRGAVSGPRLLAALSLPLDRANLRHALEAFFHREPDQPRTRTASRGED